MLRLTCTRRYLAHHFQGRPSLNLTRSLSSTACLHKNRHPHRHHHPHPQPEVNLSEAPEKETKPDEKVNYNVNFYNASPDPEHTDYTRVTANDLESFTTPPTRVKMLVRDFIEDSLYNPNYGYFPKQATIFEAKTEQGPIEFTKLRDTAEFQAEVSRRYRGYGLDGSGPGKQIWHTPTELFKPYYGQAVAQCLVAEYLLKYFPYEDLVIYEIGAGNGTLALDILDYIEEEYPEVYERTHYHIIEISKRLAGYQRNKLLPVHPCVQVTNESIFHWNTHEPRPCFFLAMEVVDNFAHDLIRYDTHTLQPVQALVTIDKNNDFGMLYERVTDPLIASFLALRRRLNDPPPYPSFLNSPTIRALYNSLPFVPNLSQPEYIPTRLLNLLRTLRSHFPRHRLLLTDFSSLPDTIPGINAPVVQTRVQNSTVATETLFVKQGFFDIFFATNFSRLRDMYEHILAQPSTTSTSDFFDSRVSPLSTNASLLSEGAGFFSSYQPRNRRPPVDGVASASGLPVGERKSNVYSHAEFVETYADLGRTRLRNGDNPMVDYYQNVKFLF